MKKWICVLLLLTAALVLTGCCISHEWAEATCAAPKTCVKCEKTEGGPLPHTWLDATCTAPKTCEVCGTTDGEPAPHTPGEWFVAEEPYNGQDGTREQRCVDCDQLLDSEAYSLSTLHNGETFTFTHEEFLNRVNTMVQAVSEEYTCEYHEKHTDETMNLSIMKNGEEVARILDSSDSAHMPLTTLAFIASKANGAAANEESFVLGKVFLMACDPMVEEDAAQTLVESLKELKILGLMSSEEGKMNELYYWMLYINNETLQIELSPIAEYPSK